MRLASADARNRASARSAADHPFWLRPDAPRAAVAALEPLRRELLELRAQLEQAMEASAAALRDAERARQESAQRRAQVSWAGGRISQLEGVLVASKLGIPAPIKPPPPAPAAAPPPATVAAPKPLGSSAVDGGVMQRLAATEAVLEARTAEAEQLRRELAAAQRAMEAQSALASGSTRRSRSVSDLAGAGAAAAPSGGELARERQRADTAERAARAAMEAVRRLTDQLEEKQAELDEALEAANPEAGDDDNDEDNDDNDAQDDAGAPQSNGDGDAHAAAVRSAAVALRAALVTERERGKALEAELAAAKRAAAAAEERAAAATAAAAAASAAAASPVRANGGSRGSRSGPGAFSGEAYDDGDDDGGYSGKQQQAAELHSPSLAMPLAPRGRRGSATGRPGDADRRAAAAEEAAEAAAAQVTRLKDALAEEKRTAEALRAQLLARAGEPAERGRSAPADDALARKRAKDAEAALAAERERRAAAEARARAASDEAERLTEQLKAARGRTADATSSPGSSGDAERIAQLERTLHREREAASRALAEARAAAASAPSAPSAAAIALPAGLDADDIGPARALMMERKRSAQLAAQLEDVTSRLARSATGGGGAASPASPAASAPGVATELARLQARCRSLQEALDASQARGCELEQDLAEARAVRSKAAASATPSPMHSPLPSRVSSPLPEELEY